MLVLTRYENERILIGDNIEVIILGNRHGKVRVGIQAPREVRVLRSEVADRKQDDTPAA